MSLLNLAFYKKMIDTYEVLSVTFCLNVRLYFTNVTCTHIMNHMAEKTVITSNADFAKMPVTFLHSIFRQFRVNMFSNIYVFHPLLMFVGSFLNHPV